MKPVLVEGPICQMSVPFKVSSLRLCVFADDVVSECCVYWLYIYIYLLNQHLINNKHNSKIKYMFVRNYSIVRGCNMYFFKEFMLNCLNFSSIFQKEPVNKNLKHLTGYTHTFLIAL